MKKSPNKWFIAVEVSLLVLAVILIWIGVALDRNNNMIYSNLSATYRDKFETIVKLVPVSGAGEETRNAIADFNAAYVPQDYRSHSNFVIAASDGTIMFRENSSYLPMDQKICLAWKQDLAVALDTKTKKKTWMQIDFTISQNITEHNELGQIGEFDATEVSELIDVAYYQYYGSSTEISIRKLAEGNNPSYLLWIRDSTVDSIIESNFSNQYGMPGYNFSTTGVFLILLYWILLPIWVFLDARRKQSQPLPWALLVLLTNIVGFVVYWIVQAQGQKPGKACPTCGGAVQANHLYCPWCAEPLVKKCTACGKALEREWVACPWCGQPDVPAALIEDSAPLPEGEAQPEDDSPAELLDEADAPEDNK